jgi:predicted small lipoprotein YifL
MKLRLILAVALALAVAGCGVKGDLEKPNTPPQKNDKDPSKPPSPFGR